MNKKGFYYHFRHVFWAFIIGVILGVVLMYLFLEGLIPVEIPFL